MKSPKTRGQSVEGGKRRESRGTAHQRGYTGRWQKASKGYLKKHPLCVACLAEGVTSPSQVVDHIDPHRGDKEKFWDRNNWQALCIPHHNRKTGRGQ